MTKALILDGKVVDISDIEFQVHPSLTWVDCPDEVAVGYSYDGTTFTNPLDSLSNEEKMDMLRSERNRLLADTDWWALSDHTMTQAQIDYRQALRDITNSYSSLDDVIWPVKP